MSGPPPALSLGGITKRFGRTLALDGAHIDVRRGTLHALLGENGAGKTTLMRVAFGMSRPDAGAITMAAAERRWRSSADAIAAGIGMVHQHFLLVPAMTVAENVALGVGGWLDTFDSRDAARRVREIGEATRLSLDPDARVADLPVGAQQRLEIIKALARNATLLILDEPTAVLSPAETQELYGWLRAYVARGCTVVLITHKVREALALADDVTVLRRGRTVLESAATQLNEATVVAAMVGAAGVPEAVRGADRSAAPGPVVMSLADVSVTDDAGVARLHRVSLEVRAGEIVGVAGIEGAGQHELLQLLAGRLAPTSGHARIPDRVGFVPEDRLRDALIPSMTLVENVALKEAGSAHGSVPWRSYQARTSTIMREHDIRASSITSSAGALSGGNQQKFVLGRELAGEPEGLVVENPTRGLDVRATAHVLAALRTARTRGVAVVAYSSDLDEVLAVADRMVVCFAGRLTETSVDQNVVAQALVGL